MKKKREMLPGIYKKTTTKISNDTILRPFLFFKRTEKLKKKIDKVGNSNKLGLAKLEVGLKIYISIINVILMCINKCEYEVILF